MTRTPESAVKKKPLATRNYSMIQMVNDTPDVVKNSNNPLGCAANFTATLRTSSTGSKKVDNTELKQNQNHNIEQDVGSHDVIDLLDDSDEGQDDVHEPNNMSKDNGLQAPKTRTSNKFKNLESTSSSKPVNEVVDLISSPSSSDKENTTPQETLDNQSSSSKALEKEEAKDFTTTSSELTPRKRIVDVAIDDTVISSNKNKKRHKHQADNDDEPVVADVVNKSNNGTDEEKEESISPSMTYDRTVAVLDDMCVDVESSSDCIVTDGVLPAKETKSKSKSKISQNTAHAEKTRVSADQQQAARPKADSNSSTRKVPSTTIHFPTTTASQKPNQKNSITGGMVPLPKDICMIPQPATMNQQQTNGGVAKRTDKKESAKANPDRNIRESSDVTLMRSGATTMTENYAIHTHSSEGCCVVEVPEGTRAGEKLLVTFPSVKKNENEMCAITVPKLEAGNRHLIVILPNEEGKKIKMSNLPSSTQPPKTPQQRKRRRVDTNRYSPSHFSPKTLMKSPTKIKRKDDSDEAQIRVGRRYQATEIPSCLDWNQKNIKYDELTPTYEQTWDPQIAQQACLRGEDIDGVIALLPHSERSAFLPILHRASYSVQQAVIEFERTRKENEKEWISFTSEEREVFNRLVHKEEKNFAKIASKMKKSVGACLTHYYSHFKPSDKYAALKALLKETEEDEDPNQYCVLCDDGGILLVCDGCHKPYHPECLSPPLEKVPEDDWFCPKCVESPTKAKCTMQLDTDAEHRVDKTSPKSCTAKGASNPEGSVVSISGDANGTKDPGTCISSEKQRSPPGALCENIEFPEVKSSGAGD